MIEYYHYYLQKLIVKSLLTDVVFASQLQRRGFGWLHFPGNSRCWNNKRFQWSLCHLRVAHKQGKEKTYVQTNETSIKSPEAVYSSANVGLLSEGVLIRFMFEWVFASDHFFLHERKRNSKGNLGRIIIIVTITVIDSV